MANKTIEVLHERCMGAGNCVEVAPDFFDQDPMDGTVILLHPQVAPGDAAAVEKAANVCPVAAIILHSAAS